MVTKLNQLSAAQLQRAATIKEQIEKLEAELAGILGQALAVTPAAAPGVVRKKRTMSAAARAKISAIRKAYWARKRGEIAPETTPSVVAKPKRRISAAGRANIIAATKARWAKYNAAKKKR